VVAAVGAITTLTAARKTSNQTSPDVTESVAILLKPSVQARQACFWSI